MRRAWLVATTTYRQRVRSGTFLLLTFGIPVLMVIAGAIPFIMERRAELPRVGYVDETDQFAPLEAITVDDEMLHLVSYAEVGAAAQAFAGGDIDGYLVIPKDYFEGGRPAFHGERSPGRDLRIGLSQFMREALLPEAPGWQRARLGNPSEVMFASTATGERVAPGPGLIFRIATPAFLALVFVFTVMTTTDQMGSAVVQEKEQRAMEMVITSLSPRELVTGKVLGMTLLTLTQIGVWLLGAAAGLTLALFGALRLEDLTIPWFAVLWAVLLGIPGYFLYAVLAAGLGIIAGDKQQARQLAGMLGFLGMSPLFFMGLIIDNLDGVLGVGLTLFPMTAPVIALFRMLLTEVPTWQMGAGLAVLIATLAASIWFVARVFRAAMLMYGQALRPRDILRALRQS